VTLHTYLFLLGTRELSSINSRRKLFMIWKTVFGDLQPPTAVKQDCFFVFGDRNTSTYIFSVMTYVASCLFCFLSIKHLTSSGAFCRRGSAALGQFASAIVSSRIVTDPDAIAYNTNHNLSINPTGGTFAGVQGGPGDHGAWGCACVRALFRVIACCNKHWAWHCASTRSSNGTGHGPVQLLKLFT